MTQTRRLLPFLLLAALLLGALPSGPGQAEAADGVSADSIVFGQSAALEGPAAALGVEMRRGILAAFHEVNAAGGIAGRRLELVSYDDGYEPERAIENTHSLIEEDRVFALIGPVGTPTSAAAGPLAVEAGVPFIGAFTGAEFLRNAGLATVINLRASYFQETEHIVQWLTRDLGLQRIAVLFQDDSYGRAGLAGVRQALGRRGLSVVSEGVYTRNTTAVKRALLAIRQGRPQAIVIVGAYAPSAAFILWARKLGLDAIYVNVSFVGSNALAEELGPAQPEGPDTYISQVVPVPESDALPVLARYRAALAAAAAENEEGVAPGFVSLEGYLAGRLTIAVLQAMAEAGEDPPTREAFLVTLRRIGSFDIDGFALAYGPDDNQGSDAVFLTEIDAGGRVVPITVHTP